MTAEQAKHLRDNHKTATAFDLSKALKVSVTTVRIWCKQLDIKPMAHASQVRSEHHPFGIRNKQLEQYHIKRGEKRREAVK